MNRILVASVAAAALAASGAVFAQSPERNVFDTEAHLALPAATSTVSREAVRQAYIDQRARQDIASFNPESWRREWMAGSGDGIVALFKGRGQDGAATAVAGGKSRAEVRAEFLAARARGEVDTFDTEAALRIPATSRQPAPSAYAQR